MPKVYEIRRIKQVIQEVEGGEHYLIRSPHDAAKIVAKFIAERMTGKYASSCA